MDAKIENISRAQFLKYCANPPQWFINHAREKADILARVLEDDRLNYKDKLSICQTLHSKYGANIIAPPTPLKNGYVETNRSPICLAMRFEFHEIVDSWINNSSKEVLGVAFTEATYFNDDRLMEKIYSKGISIDRTNVGLQDVLWSNKWSNVFFDSGVYFTKEFNKENINDMFASLGISRWSYYSFRNPKSSIQDVFFELLDILNLIDKLERRKKKDIIKKVRGQNKEYKVRWDELFSWIAENELNSWEIVEWLTLKRKLGYGVHILPVKTTKKHEEIIDIDKTMKLIRSQHKHMSNLQKRNVIRGKGLLGKTRIIDIFYYKNYEEIQNFIEETAHMGFKRIFWIEAIESEIKFKQTLYSDTNKLHKVLNELKALHLKESISNGLSGVIANKGVDTSKVLKRKI